MAMTFKALIKIETHQSKSPRDIEQICNSLHQYIERAFEEDQAILASHNVVTDCTCQTCHRDDTEALYAMMRDLKRHLENRNTEMQRMRDTINAIKSELIEKADSEHLAGFEGPATRAIKWCKQWV